MLPSVVLAMPCPVPSGSLLKTSLRTSAPPGITPAPGLFAENPKALLRAYYALANDLGEENFLSATEEEPGVD